LSGEKKLVNVVTKEIFTYEEEIPYETEEREDNTLLRGQTRVIQEGREGTKEIKARIIRENGIEVTRELIEEKVVEEPVKEIIAVAPRGRQFRPGAEIPVHLEFLQKMCLHQATDLCPALI